MAEGITSLQRVGIGFTAQVLMLKSALIPKHIIEICRLACEPNVQNTIQA